MLRRPVLSERLPLPRAQQAVADLIALPLQRAPQLPLLARCWSLRDNLSVYDGSYVALAESLDCVLLTADTGLSRAPGLRCVVEVVQRLWPVYLDSRVSLHVRHLGRAQAAPLPAQQR